MVELFRRRQGTLIKRHTIESLTQQRDPTRRARGEVRTLLAKEGLDLLCGTWIKDRTRSLALGGPPLHRGEWICLPNTRHQPAIIATQGDE